MWSTLPFFAMIKTVKKKVYSRTSISCCDSMKCEYQREYQGHRPIGLINENFSHAPETSPGWEMHLAAPFLGTSAVAGGFPALSLIGDEGPWSCLLAPQSWCGIVPSPHLNIIVSDQTQTCAPQTYLHSLTHFPQTPTCIHKRVVLFFSFFYLPLFSWYYWFSPCCFCVCFDVVTAVCCCCSCPPLF